MAGHFIELDKVSLRYGDEKEGTLALRDMSFKVEQGEFVAVVGPSGCGKSTLMKIVTGLWRPDRGVVIVNNKEVAEPLGFVGMAFQNPTLLPWRRLSPTFFCRSKSKTGASNAATKLRLKRPAAFWGSWAFPLLKVNIRGNYPGVCNSAHLFAEPSSTSCPS